MRISKRDFLKLFTSTAVAVPITRAHTSRLAQPELQPVPNVSIPDGSRLGTWQPAEEVEHWYDVRERMLYDRIHFKGRIPNRFTMFTVPAGQLCPHMNLTKWHEHTNMTNPGFLAVPTMFWIRRIHLMVDRDTQKKDLSVLDRFAWKLWVGQKSFADGPVLKDSRRVSGLVDVLKLWQPVTRQSLELHASNGLFIPQGLTFHSEFTSSAHDFQLTLEPASDGVDLWMGLEGVEARPVQ